MRKSAQLSEQEEMLRKTVKMLQDAGMTIEDVAKSLGKDLETIQSFIVSIQPLFRWSEI